MKAIVQDRYGSADVLELREIARPVPGDDEVLVRVEAASVNAYDWHFMRGDPYLARLMMGLGGPKAKVRGRDCAGVVEAVGARVTGLKPGDEVFGEVDGTFAEYVCVPDAMVSLKPANLTFTQAAALPLAGNTALCGLRDLEAGQRVLINGASGGVGTMAVQLAKARGAEVTGVCSTRNVDLVRSLGADHVVDYQLEDFAQQDRRYDLVFDLVGNRSLGDLRSVLVPDGTLALSGGGTSNGGSLIGPLSLFLKARLVSWFVPHRIVSVEARQTKENLDALREFAEAGTLVPVIEKTYPLSEAAEAIRHVEMTHARAKVVVTT